MAFVLALLVVVVGLAVAVAIGRIPATPMDDPTATTPYEGLPAGPISDDALESLRFDQTMRGYRMTQVDHVIDRLRDELAERDREIARLRGQDWPDALLAPRADDEDESE
ncbi:DivIVA domain-containing protein [Demetria terragena]|uniref:DivIVA domain-containing protein n=1 Tax=Demetria terragena TaxID=63959 RepID=UPI00037609C6|nr:DivIVA domain-containing protein [Demetria terragena]